MIPIQAVSLLPLEARGGWVRSTTPSGVSRLVTEGSSQSGADVRARCATDTFLGDSTYYMLPGIIRRRDAAIGLGVCATLLTVMNSLFEDKSQVSAISTASTFFIAAILHRHILSVSELVALVSQSHFPASCRFLAFLSALRSFRFRNAPRRSLIHL